jgi:hypothetical protein
MNMKYLAIIFVTWFGCTKISNDEKLKFNPIELELIDTETYLPFSKVTMIVPEIFDSLMTWIIPYSDCCCFYAHYRFTNKKYCLIQDSPLYGKFCNNNYYYLTISHECRSTQNVYTNLKYFTEETNEINYRKSLDHYTPLINWSRIALVQIKNRDWYIARGFNYECDVDYSRELLYAKTLLNNRWINFNLECKMNSCICFDSIASKMIYSINFINTKNK